MYMEMQKNKLELLKKDILNSLTIMQRDIEGIINAIEGETTCPLNIYGTIGMNALYLIKCEAEYNKIEEMLMMTKERIDEKC